MTRVGSRRLAALLALSLLTAVVAAAAALQRWLDAPLAIEGPSERIDVPRGEPLAVTAALPA